MKAPPASIRCRGCIQDYLHEHPQIQLVTKRWFSCNSDGNLSFHNKAKLTELQCCHQGLILQGFPLCSIPYPRDSYLNQTLMTNIYNTTFRVNDSRNKAVYSHQKSPGQSRSEAVDRMLSAATGGSHLPPGSFVPQSSRANRWAWRDRLLWLGIHLCWFMQVFQGTSWILNVSFIQKATGKIVSFPQRKLLPQHSKTKDTRDSLNRRKSFFVWKAKLPERVQRSPFLPLEGAALLWSTEGASVIQRWPLLTPMQT